MSRLALVRVVTIGVTVLLATVITVLAQSPTNTSTNFVESLRVWGGVLGMIALFIGGGAYMYAAARTNTVAIYRENVDAERAKNDRLDTELKVALKLGAEREALIVKLTAQTDLTAVMKLLQGAITTGDTRYSESMGMMSTLLKDILDQSKHNQDLLFGLNKTLEHLSRRFGQVESNVRDVAESVGVDLPKPDAHPDERRKGER